MECSEEEEGVRNLRHDWWLCRGFLTIRTSSPSKFLSLSVNHQDLSAPQKKQIPQNALKNCIKNTNDAKYFT